MWKTYTHFHHHTYSHKEEELGLPPVLFFVLYLFHLSFIYLSTFNLSLSCYFILLVYFNLCLNLYFLFCFVLVVLCKWVRMDRRHTNINTNVQLIKTLQFDVILLLGCFTWPFRQSHRAWSSSSIIMLLIHAAICFSLFVAISATNK